jgi:2-methylisocitrate lyase-like PEP mutase family enzyme
MTSKTETLRSLHVPGNPLIVTNVWDAVTARIVAGVPGVKALATASHSISFAHGVDDGEGLTLDQALAAAKLVIDATELPVSVDFERGYSTSIEGLKENIVRLVAVGAAGLNLEDTQGDRTLFPIEEAAARVAAVRDASNLVINARSDALARGASFEESVTRANAYLAAGADCIFVLGLNTEDKVKRALDEIDGKISVFAGPSSPSLARLAELGVSRVSFGPGLLGLTLAHLQTAATQLTALGEYPEELGFSF